MDWIKDILGSFVGWLFDGWIMWAVFGAIVGMIALFILFGTSLSARDKRSANALRQVRAREHDERPTQTITFVPNMPDPDAPTIADLMGGTDLSEYVTDVTVDTGEVLTPTEETDDDEGTASDGPGHEGDQDRDTSESGGFIPVYRPEGDHRIFNLGGVEFEYVPELGEVIPRESRTPEFVSEPGDPESGREPRRGHDVLADRVHSGPRSVRVGYGPWEQWVSPGEFYPFD